MCLLLQTSIYLFWGRISLIYYTIPHCNYLVTSCVDWYNKADFVFEYCVLIEVDFCGCFVGCRSGEE